MVHKIERKRVINHLHTYPKNKFHNIHVGEVGMITQNICFVSYNIDEVRETCFMAHNIKCELTRTITYVLWLITR